MHAAARTRAAEPLGMIARDEFAVAPDPVLERAFAVRDPFTASPSAPSAVAPRTVQPLGSVDPVIPVQSAMRALALDPDPQPVGFETRAEPPARSREPTPAPLLVNIPRDSTSEAEPRLPSSLLDAPRPLRPHTTLATGPGARGQQLTAATERDSEPTEVHVHIGRIEITAEKQVPVRSKPAAARKTVGLDDYLAKRHRGAP